MLSPKATKGGLIGILQEKGYDIPRSGKASLTRINHSWWLNWTDSKGTQHTAYFTCTSKRPVLQVDTKWVRVTVNDAIKHDLVREIKPK